MTKKNKQKRNNRSGFTIVELIVSLTLIVLVSAVAISVVTIDTRTYKEAIDMVEATNVAENAVECFRFAENTGENFETLFVKTLSEGQKMEGGGDSYIVSFDDVKVSISISGNTITVSASSGTDEFLIDDVTYEMR